MADNRNFNVTNKIFSVLNDIKGFDVATSNPRAGKIIAKYQGVSFCVSVEPLYKDTPEGNKAEEQSFDKIVSSHNYIFN